MDYDPAGMITNIMYNDRRSVRYTYDSLDRLTGEYNYNISQELIASKTYTYDLAGNRTEVTNNGVTENYQLGQGNRLASWGAGNSMSYDAAGNVTQIVYDSGRVLDLEWNDRYQLICVKTNSVEAERYEYDPYDRRSAIIANGETTHLVYDGIHCVAETDASGNLFKSYVYGPGVDNILHYIDHSGPTPKTYSYIKDHIGTVQAVLDETGQVVERYAYDAWGNILAIYGADGAQIQESAIGNRYLFQGREVSWTTGLANFRARWYDPGTGRWLSKDPIGISGGLNQYVAFNNNAVMYLDPFGLTGCENEIVSPDEMKKIVKKSVRNAEWWWVIVPSKHITAFCNHGGQWSSLDLKINDSQSLWHINGRILKADQFGNYLAGYYAGYTRESNIYLGMRTGGHLYALFSAGESWRDEGSIPLINEGFLDGWIDRINDDEPPPVPIYLRLRIHIDD